MVTDHLHHYWCRATSVYDGDTVTADIQCGFGIGFTQQKLRLYGINTPEIRGGTPETKQAGREARDFLRELILDKWIIVQTLKDSKGKYGRYLAILWMPDDQEEATEFVNINELLISQGYAEAKIY